VGVGPRGLGDRRTPPGAMVVTPVLGNRTPASLASSSLEESVMFIGPHRVPPDVTFTAPLGFALPRVSDACQLLCNVSRRQCKVFAKVCAKRVRCGT